MELITSKKMLRKANKEKKKKSIEFEKPIQSVPELQETLESLELLETQLVKEQPVKSTYNACKKKKRIVYHKIEECNDIQNSFLVAKRDIEDNERSKEQERINRLENELKEKEQERIIEQERLYNLKIEKCNKIKEEIKRWEQKNGIRELTDDDYYRISRKMNNVIQYDSDSDSDSDSDYESSRKVSKQRILFNKSYGMRLHKALPAMELYCEILDQKKLDRDNGIIKHISEYTNNFGWNEKYALLSFLSFSGGCSCIDDYIDFDANPFNNNNCYNDYIRKYKLKNERVQERKKDEAARKQRMACKK